MPITSVNTDTFQSYKNWKRNGPGPYVAHPYLHRWGRIISSNWPEATLTNGGAYAIASASIAAPVLQEKLYGKFREAAYATLQLGADFGERRQTLDLIGNSLKMARRPLETVGGYLKKVAKRRNLKSAASLLLKDSAQALLAFRYGVLPLMQTVWGLRDVLSKPFPRHSINVRATSELVRTQVVTNPTRSYRQETTTWSVIRGGMGAKAEVATPISFSMDQLGLINPLSVAWELVPFSFVVDWFLPIGKYISSLSDFAGVKFTDAHYTLVLNARVKRERPLQGKQCTDRAFCINRVLQSPSLPGLSTMQFKWKQSKVHIQNAIALIVALKL